MAITATQAAKTATNASSTNSTNSTSSGASASSSTSSAGQLDYNAFLTLFLTQLKYQDPTNPLQSYELAAQLAQFSSVAQLTEANTNLVKVESDLSALNNAQMIDLIGKQVVGQASALQVTSGKATNLNYQIGEAGTVTVKIYDENSQLVRTMNVGKKDAGTYQITWDGKNDSGSTASDGTYVAKVTAVDASGNSLDVTTTISGLVYSLILENGSTYLILNSSDGIKLPSSDVLEVTASSS
jgi:flagellar basal-body rod modification protein FlgD